MTEEILSPAKLREIGERALTFQRYVYRRAWGTYYAVWSAAFIVFVYSSLLPLQTLAPQSLSWLPFALLYGGVGLAAGIASGWIFKNAYRAILFRRAVDPHPSFGGRKWALIWVWWALFYALSFVAFTLFQREALSILYGLLFSVEIFIFFGLRLSFRDRVPLEGRLATYSYGVCILLSFLASLFTGAFLPFAIIWSATTAVWLFCALYALDRAPEELAELRY